MSYDLFLYKLGLNTFLLEGFLHVFSFFPSLSENAKHFFVFWEKKITYFSGGGSTPNPLSLRFRWEGIFLSAPLIRRNKLANIVYWLITSRSSLEGCLRNIKVQEFFILLYLYYTYLHDFNFYTIYKPKYDYVSVN